MDLIGFDGSEKVVVEVRSVTGPNDPIDAVGDAKRRQVISLSRKLGASRVDFLGIRFGDTHVDFHWIPGSL